LRQRQCQCQKQQRYINVPERDDPTVFAVLGMIAINPGVSTRQINRELGIPKSTSHRILTTHNFYPYLITLTQQLTLNDFQQRLEFCRWTQIMLNCDRIFFRFVLLNDKATLSQHWTIKST